MKKYFRGLLMVLVMCSIMIPNVVVKAEEREGEEVSQDANNVGVPETSGDYTYEVLRDGSVEITKYNGNATVVNVPSQLGGKNVTKIGNRAFDSRDEIESITLPEGLKSIGEYAFSHCTGLTTITLPEGLTSIGGHAFTSCTGITAITLPEGLPSIGYGVFSNCTGLKSITLPEGLESIWPEAFTNCTGLTTITLPEGVTTIGGSAFTNCKGLTSITLPEGLESIGPFAFTNCTGLTSITLPEGLECIWSYAFNSCSNLKSVNIPDSVTDIGEDIFYWCHSDLVIYCSPTSYAATYARENNIKYAQKPIEELKVTLSQTTYTYDGKEKKPTVTIKEGNKTLKLGTDYTVSYTKNKVIGKATVTITGTGNGGYGGTVKKTFTIKKGDYYSRITHGGTWKNESYTLGGVKMTDVFFFDGAYTYYLQADGTPMKNRLTYHPDGVHLIYFDGQGHELFDKFQYCSGVGYTCYFDTSGYLYKDVITFVDGKPYYLDGNGKMKQNEYFRFANGVDLGYAQADGSLINTGFGYDPFGQVVFYHWNGMIARGLITDGVWYYNMDETDGHLIGKFAAN